MDERRFSDAEAAAIFEQTAQAQLADSRELPSSETRGLTLAELQDIGREVGIAPELIAQAARAIDRVGKPTWKRFLGLPIGVGRTVYLHRTLSESDWDRLVIDLRETFDAKGKQTREGSFRQWTNGNLQALLEPTDTGHRLRLRTVKGEARSMIVFGLSVLGLGAAGLAFAALRGTLVQAGPLLSFGVMAAWGGTLFAMGALRLPRWARLRSRQMEDVATRLASDDAAARIGGGNRAD
jgi:hypothetical protein